MKCGGKSTSASATPASEMVSIALVAMTYHLPVMAWRPRSIPRPPSSTSILASMAAALDVAPGEDAGDVVQDVGRRVLVVAVVSDQAAFDDIDLFLRVLVDHAGDQAGEL